jgi:proline iminopeptidase
MREIMVEAPGAALAVRESREDGDSLLLLHGGPGVPDSMQATIAQLLPEMRGISFDQRGVGSSVCRDGRYGIAAYLGDIEAVREALAIPAWHVLGHSWGGLLAQAYAARHRDRVSSLVLSSSSLGVGADWKQTKREAFRTSRQRGGLWGTVRLYGYGAGLGVPGRVRGWAMRHVMTETWHDYFLDPRQAPDPDKRWLGGCSASAMIRTDRAVSREGPALLSGLASYAGPVMVLYGQHDIFGTSADVVRRRLPRALQVTLEGSGHLHWLQNEAGYREVLRRFYAAAGALPPEDPARPEGSPSRLVTGTDTAGPRGPG